MTATTDLATWVWEHRASLPPLQSVALLDAGFEPVLLLDVEGTVLHATPAFEAAFGLPAGRLLGRRAIALVGRQDIRRARVALDDVVRHPVHAPSIECCFRAPDGSRGAVRLAARRVTYERGPAILVSVLDVTEYHRQAEQLRQAQKMEEIGRLTAGLTHDFNNVLTVVLSYAELLVQRAGGSPETQGLVDEIRHSARHACALSRHLLLFSRSQALPARVLEVNALIADVEPMLRRLLGERVEAVVSCAATRSAVLADPCRLEQILVNIAVNARDAMPDGGVLTITTTNRILDPAEAAGLAMSAGGVLEITIADTGTGMCAATLARAFDPFFTTKAPGYGTGLGLATVQQVVRHLGGAVSVRSEVGVGTTFTVALPLVDTGAECCDGESAYAIPDRGSETVLLVEDERAVREAARQVLTGLGYTVIGARHGHDALELVRTRKEDIDLLVTDVVMPEMGGAELATTLRAVRPSLPVLFMSGYTLDEGAVPVFTGTPAGFLQKPFKGSDLARAVRKTLDGDAAGVQS